MGKLSFIKEAVDMARSIPKFFYNDAFVLSLMRRFTRNKELRRPAMLNWQLGPNSMWISLFITADIFIGSLSSRGVGLIQRSSDSDKYLWRYEFILFM